MAGTTRVRMRVIGQDPSVLDQGRILTAEAVVPFARLKPGPETERFHVVDYDATLGTLYPAAELPEEGGGFAGAEDATLVTDFGFHAQQVYAVAARTLATFEAALGRRINWAFEGHHLFLVPHAFTEANAYYAPDDRAVLFGYVPLSDRAPVYTCLSHDVVAHETAHAVLDGLRSRFLEPGLPDQAAFHEGFADVVALLSLFSLAPVVEKCLGCKDADGRIPASAIEPARLRENVLTGVGEQIGAVLTQGRGALRRSALEPPPPNWALDPRYLEPHNRGEVLVAIILDVLIDIWAARLRPILSGGPNSTVDCARAAEEGAKAAGHLLNMAIRGLDYLPPVEFEFRDFLCATLLADREVVPDDDLRYREKLLDRFRLSNVDGAVEGYSPAPPEGLDYEGLSFTALRTDADEVFRFMWRNADRLGFTSPTSGCGSGGPGQDSITSFYTHVESVRPSQRVGPDGLILSESVATYIEMAELTAGDLERRSKQPLPPGLDAGTAVKVFGGGTLVFDQFGRLKFHFRKALNDWDRQMRRLRFLRSAGLYTPSGIGSSYAAAAGQIIAQFHRDHSSSGETW